MRVVSYARVSSDKQESEGQSLVNQERAFVQWLTDYGHIRVSSYREAASAGTVVKRDEFVRMIADLSLTKPDAIIIDSIDRFTRNLRDGLELLEQLRGHGVGLLPLDWRRAHPINVDDDRDWADVVSEFTAAERERRRIRRRVLRSYEGRRERGATTWNQPPYGLIKAGDRIVPDPDRIGLMMQIEDRALAGESFEAIATWAPTVDPKAAGVGTSIARLLRHPLYVECGARSPERQALLDRILAMKSARFGKIQKFEHAFTGVFECGICAERGVVTVMTGGGARDGNARLKCNLERPGHFSIEEHRLVAYWDVLIGELAIDLPTAQAWAEAQAPDKGADRRRMLERQVARFDQQEAALRLRRDRALTLVGDRDAVIDRQGRAALREIDSDEMALRVSRESLTAELAAAQPPTPVDPAVIVATFAKLREAYSFAEPREQNRLSRLLVDALGSRPVLSRTSATKWGTPVISWPELDALRKSPRRAAKTR